MSRIHEKSPAAVLPQLALWELPGTQEMVSKDVTAIIRPISTFSSSTPTRFEIRPPLDEYVLLNESELYIRMKVTLKHASATIKKEDWDNISVAPNLMHSLFRYVNLVINGRQINISPSIYSFRAFLETLLTFSDTAKKGLLSSIGWDNGKDLIKDGISASKPQESVFELQGILHTDLTFQEKAILGGTPLVIELIPHDSSFYFRGKGGFSVDVSFEDVYFRCQRLQVVPEVVDAHSQVLKVEPTKYSFTRTELRHRTIPANVNDFSMDNLFSGVLPRRIVIGFVSNNGFNGIGDGIPYDFKNFSLNFLTTYIDGRHVPAIPFTPDFDAKLTTREFHALYKALNQTGTDTFYAKTVSEWRNLPLYAINYAPDLSNGGSLSSHVNKRQVGQLSLHVKFQTKNTDPIVCVILSETDSCLEIDALRQVHLDY